MRLRDSIEYAYNAFDDIVNISEIAFMVAVIEHIDRAPFEYCAREQEQSHIGPAPGAVYGEESQTRGRQTKCARIAVRHQLIRPCGRGVEGHGMGRGFVYRIRQLRARAVD